MRLPGMYKTGCSWPDETRKYLDWPDCGWPDERGKYL